MEFLNYTRELNELAKKYQDSNEIISDDDLIKAIFYLNNMYINDTGDCLIFLASLNLCNAYLKQDKNKISYSFKKGIEYLIQVLNNRDIKDIFVSYTNDNGKLYIFQIGNIQFSFHDEKIIEINEKYLRELSWDGIRKQRCAKVIFDSTIKNKLRVTNNTYRGKKISDKLEKVLDNYKNKKVNIGDLLIFRM